MTSAEQIQATLDEIDRVMVHGGYSRLDDTLVVSGVPFEVVRAYVAGSGFLDLVVVIDAMAGTSHQLQHGVWLVERIARALDQAKSKRPLTAIVLHDAKAARVPTEEFLRIGRVLLVTEAAKVEAELAPILPIFLEPSSEVGQDPLETMLASNNSGNDEPSRVELIEAARLGADRVQASLVAWLDRSFEREGAEDDQSTT